MLAMPHGRRGRSTCDVTGEEGTVEVIEGAGRYTDPGSAPNHYVEQLRVPELSVGSYSIPAGGADDQTPHSEDEIYVITTGRARMTTGSGDAHVGPGDVIFVPAGEHHRFVDVEEDLALLVVFAPAEGTRAVI
jgi:quercetin dioxygenase-like cupin family protein